MAGVPDDVAAELGLLPSATPVPTSTPVPVPLEPPPPPEFPGALSGFGVDVASTGASMGAEQATETALRRMLGLGKAAGPVGALAGAAASGAVGYGGELIRQVGMPPPIRDAAALEAGKDAISGDLVGRGLFGLGKGALGIGRIVLNRIGWSGRPIEKDLAKMMRGRTPTPDEFDALAFNKVMDHMAETRKITDEERRLIRAGKLDVFKERRFKEMAQELGPVVDHSSLVTSMLGKSKKDYNTLQGALGSIYDDINEEVGGKLRLPGEAPTAHPYVTDARNEAIAGPIRLTSNELGEFPSLGATVEGGFRGSAKPVRAYAQKLTALSESSAEPAAGRVNALMRKVAELPDSMPYLQVDALRKEIGLFQRQLPRGASQALKGRVKGLYGVLSETQAKILSENNRGDLADLLRTTNKAYGEGFQRYQNDFMRTLSDHVDPMQKGNVTDAIDAINKASRDQIEELADVIGPAHASRLRATVVSDMLWNQAAETGTDGVTTLSGKSLAEAIHKREAQLEPLFRDRPHVWQTLKNIALVQGAEKKIGTQSRNVLAKKRAVELDMDGAIVSQMVKDPTTGLPTLVHTRYPRRLVEELLMDPGASRTFMEAIAAPAMRVTAGVAGRQAERHMDVRQRGVEVADLMAEAFRVSMDLGRRDPANAMEYLPQQLTTETLVPSAPTPAPVPTPGPMPLLQ